MKKTRCTLLAAALLGTATLSARPIGITVSNVRNGKGFILATAVVPGLEKTVYGMAEARTGSVTVTLDMPDGPAEISLLHDENANYKMDLNDRKPAEGYAQKRCEVAGPEPKIEMEMYYPSSAAEK